jgi:hypothetical protein
MIEEEYRISESIVYLSKKISMVKIMQILFIYHRIILPQMIITDEYF